MKTLTKMEKIFAVLESIAESDTEDARIAMKMLRAVNCTYHFCPDWDEAVISDKHNEYECCTCDKSLFHAGVTKPSEHKTK